jgi:hypothetical protein
MAATITFNAGQGGVFQLLGAASGVGFYGTGFGTSVQVGKWQDTTWITDTNGTIQGSQANNCKPVSLTAGESGVWWNGATNSGVLQSIPNQSGTLNVRFTFTDTPVATQNAKFIAYDGSNKDVDPVGVVCWAGELRKPWSLGFPGYDEANLGSGDATWTNIHGSGSYLNLWASPGASGLRPLGVDTKDYRHDWYIAIAAQPTGIGSKHFGFWVECEYL